MKIRDHIQLLKTELHKIAEDATWGEYGETTQGSEIIRGHHVTVRIPTRVNLGPYAFDHIVELFHSNLCNVEWDGKIERSDFGDQGKCYELIMDVV